MNISNLKSKFPVFKKNPNLVFLDTAASALKVDEMIKATNNCYTNEYANIHRGNYELSSKLTKKFEDARKKIADYLNTSVNNIIFVKSATEGINLIASCMSKRFLEDGDEIILSYLEHHANLIPWHLIEKKIKITPLGLNENSEINYDELNDKINSKTKLGFFLNTGNFDFKLEIFILLYLSILLTSFVLFQTFVHYQYYLILH